MRSTFLFLCWFFLEPLQAQSEWNQLIELQHPHKAIYDLIVDEDDNIIIYAFAYEDTVNWLQGVLVAKLDSNGMVLHERFIRDSTGGALAIDRYWGRIVNTPDGGYAATAATFSNIAYLIKLNHSFEVEFIKKYPPGNMVSNFRYTPIVWKDGYLLFGSMQRPDLTRVGMVKYVDASGELVWETLIEDSPYSTIVMDIKVQSDTTLLVLTIASLIPIMIASPDSSKSLMHVMNEIGSIGFTWESEPEPEVGFLQNIVSITDENIVTFGVAAKGYLNNGFTRLLQPTIAKFDTAFNVVSFHSFGPVRAETSVHSLRDFNQTTTGHFIGVGNTSEKTGNEPSRGKGWVYAFSSDIDSLWSRKITTPLPDVYPNGGTFYGIGRLSSGNLIMGGTATDGDNKYAWIVKLTPDGCLDTLFCQTSSAPSPLKDVKNRLHAYPNPAFEAFWVELPDYSEPSALSVYNAMGSLVTRILLPEVADRVPVQSAGWQPGVYTVVHEASGARVRVVVN